jgi:hypothetical protein
MLYRGRINAFFGEPEAGKTLLAQLAVVQEIAKGNCVVYVDYEDSKESAVERLRALGAKDDDIAQHFIYFDAQHPMLDDKAEELLSELIEQRGPVTLAVFDGVTAAMSMGQLDPIDGSDVTRFYAAAPRWFADHGAAVLLLDHVAKDKMGRGRWAIGSERKVSAIDGAAYTLKTVKTFGRGRTGKVEVAIAKDRPGYVRQHEGQGQTIAIFEPRSLDDGKIEVRLLPAEQASEDGSFRRTIYMDRVSKVLETASGPLTARAVRELTEGKNEYIGSALQALVQEGYVQSKPGPRNSTLYLSIKLFRDGTPPPGVVFAPKDDEDCEDEMDEPLITSLRTTPVLPGPPPKGVGTRNQSNRQIPGTTGNRSGTTTANGEPENNRGRRTPLAGGQRFVSIVRQAR